MKKFKKRINNKKPLALLMTLVISMSSISVMGSKLDELKEQQAEIQQQTQDAKNKLEDTQNQMSEVESEITALDVELDEVTAEYEQTSSNLEATRELLAQTEIELEEAQEQREVAYEMLKSRMRYMYMNGSLSYLDVIFEARSFSDLLSLVEYINCIVEYDNNVVTEYQAAEELIETKLAEVEETEAAVSALADQLEADKELLETKLAEKEERFGELSVTEQQYQEQLDSLDAGNAEVEALIKAEEERLAAEEAAKAAAAKSSSSSSSSSGTSANYNGTMGWPVQGYSGVNSNYGYRTHPVYGTYKLHSGADLQAPYGATIVAAESGTVTAATYMSGYGYTVVINHGGGVSTLYGHNSKLLVSTGDTVSKGEAIAKAGSSGTATGPHCHFEVRINGSAVNPRPYLGY